MSTEKRAGEFWIMPTGKMYQPEQAYSVKSELEKITPISEAHKIVHLREVIEGDADLGPGIAWAIAKLKNAPQMNGKLPTLWQEMAAWLRDEARRLGIEAK